MKNASIRVNVEKQIPNVGLRLFSIPLSIGIPTKDKDEVNKREVCECEG
jgi:hypothetical protein